MAATPNSQSLLIASLLALAGGMTDADVYLLHGHVFANAMTGNVVLLGATLVAHDFAQAAHHAWPLLAFCCGVLAARAWRAESRRDALFYGLLVQAIIYFLMGYFAARMADNAVTSILAFATASQVANFRKVDRFTYNSTFVTGNLRDLSEGLFESLERAPEASAGTRLRGRRKLRDLSLVCGCFFVGVSVGAWLTRPMHDRTLWMAVLPIAAAAFILRHHWRPVTA
jgi:uncharacterized membrane protein YoaK (UPF0700 family)